MSSVPPILPPRIVYRGRSPAENLRQPGRGPFPPNTIRTRFVSWDFVLKHLRTEYSKREDDKLKYFCPATGHSRKETLAQEALLPGGRSTTERPRAYFVDSSPRFLSSSSLSPPVVTFRSSIPDLASGTFQDPSARLMGKSVRRRFCPRCGSSMFPPHSNAVSRLARKISTGRGFSGRPSEEKVTGADEKFLRYFRLRSCGNEREITGEAHKPRPGVSLHLSEQGLTGK